MMPRKSNPFKLSSMSYPSHRCVLPIGKTLDGLTLPPDHPFWATHYPPNGWGCGCIVRGANSDRRVAKVGGDLSKPLPDGWNVRDAKTGAPAGIGKLWDYAPDSPSYTFDAMQRVIDPSYLGRAKVKISARRKHAQDHPGVQRSVKRFGKN